MGVHARIEQATTDLHLAATNLIILYGRVSNSELRADEHTAEVLLQDIHRLRDVQTLLEELNDCFV